MHTDVSIVRIACTYFYIQLQKEIITNIGIYVQEMLKILLANDYCEKVVLSVFLCTQKKSLQVVFTASIFCKLDLD